MCYYYGRGVTMDTRMNKYYEDEEELVNSRFQKNENLYKEINKNELDNYEVKSNSTVLGETKAEIDVEKIKKILDTRYNETPKRKSIRLEPVEEEVVEKEITKEYDINVVLEKAKENKPDNYEEERLQKLKDTQYDILNSLKINKTEEDENSKPDNLQNLINTIAFNEKNSKNNVDLDLLSDLKGDENTEVLEGLKENIEENNQDESINIQSENNNEEEEDLEKTKLMDSFYTSSNSLVKNDFDDEGDFSKEIDNGNVFVKIAIVIISLIFAGGLVLLIKILFFS